MPIFRVKSVKIYTGQKNLHWRRQWRQWQLWGMTVGMKTWLWGKILMHSRYEIVIVMQNIAIQKHWKQIINIDYYQYSNVGYMRILIKKQWSKSLTPWNDKKNSSINKIFNKIIHFEPQNASPFWWEHF